MQAREPKKHQKSHTELNRRNGRKALLPDRFQKNINVRMRVTAPQTISTITQGNESCSLKHLYPEWVESHWHWNWAGPSGRHTLLSPVQLLSVHEDI